MCEKTLSRGVRAWCLFAAVLMVGGTLKGYADEMINLVCRGTDFGANPTTNTTFTLTPTGPLRRTYGTNLITLVSRGIRCDTNGVATFTNTLWGKYRLDIPGNIASSFNLDVGTNHSGNVSAATFVTPSGFRPPDPATNYYTQAQMDALLLQVQMNGGATNGIQQLNGVGTNTTLINPTIDGTEAGNVATTNYVAAVLATNIPAGIITNIAASGDATGVGSNTITLTVTNVQPPGAGVVGSALIKTASGVRWSDGSVLTNLNKDAVELADDLTVNGWVTTLTGFIGDGANLTNAGSVTAAVTNRWRTDATNAVTAATNGYPWTNVSYVQAQGITNGWPWTNLTVAHASAVTNGWAWTNLPAASVLAAITNQWQTDATNAATAATNGWPWTNLTVAHASAVTNGYPWTNLAANSVTATVTNQWYDSGSNSAWKSTNGWPWGVFYAKLGESNWFTSGIGIGGPLNVSGNQTGQAIYASAMYVGGVPVATEAGGSATNAVSTVSVNNVAVGVNVTNLDFYTGTNTVLTSTNLGGKVNLAVNVPVNAFDAYGAATAATNGYPWTNVTVAAATKAVQDQNGGTIDLAYLRRTNAWAEHLSVTNGLVVAANPSTLVTLYGTNGALAVIGTDEELADVYGSTFYGAFSGNGASLTALPAGQLSGTVPFANLPSGVLTNVDARIWTNASGLKVGSATQLQVDSNGQLSAPTIGVMTTPNTTYRVDVAGDVRATNFFGGLVGNASSATNVSSGVTNAWQIYAQAMTNGYGWTNLTVAHAGAVTNGYPWTNIAASSVTATVTNQWYASGTNAAYNATNGYPWTNVTVAKATASVNSTNFWGQLSPTNYDGGQNAGTSTYLRGDGTWITPPGGGGGGWPATNDTDYAGYSLTNAARVEANTFLGRGSNPGAVLLTNGTELAIFLNGTNGTVTASNFVGSAAQLTGPFGAFTNHSDVSGAALSAGNVLAYNGAGVWTNGPPSAGSGSGFPLSNDADFGGFSATNVNSIEATNLNVQTANFTNATFVNLANGLLWVNGSGAVSTTNAATAAVNATNFWGQLSPTNYNAGVNASTATYLRGDGTWVTPPGGGGGGWPATNDTDYAGYSATNVDRVEANQFVGRGANPGALSLSNAAARTVFLDGTNGSGTFSNATFQTAFTNKGVGYFESYVVVSNGVRLEPDGYVNITRTFLTNLNVSAANGNIYLNANTGIVAQSGSFVGNLIGNASLATNVSAGVTNQWKVDATNAVRGLAFTNHTDVLGGTLAVGDVLGWNGTLWTNGPPGAGTGSGFPLTSDANFGGFSATNANAITATGTVTAASLVAKTNVSGVDVRSFGAKVDGATDDTAAMQAALNTAQVVLVPAGTMVVTAPLTVPSYGGIVGQGPATTILRRTGHGACILVDGTNNTTRKIYTTLQGFQIQGDNTAGAGDYGIVYHHANTQHSLRDVSIRQCGDIGLFFKGDCFEIRGNNIALVSNLGADQMLFQQTPDAGAEAANDITLADVFILPATGTRGIHFTNIAQQNIIRGLSIQSPAGAVEAVSFDGVYVKWNKIIGMSSFDAQAVNTMKGFCVFDNAAANEIHGFYGGADSVPVFWFTNTATLNSIFGAAKEGTPNYLYVADPTSIGNMILGWMGDTPETPDGSTKALVSGWNGALKVPGAFNAGTNLIVAADGTLTLTGVVTATTFSAAAGTFTQSLTSTNTTLNGGFILNQPTVGSRTFSYANGSDIYANDWIRFGRGVYDSAAFSDTASMMTGDKVVININPRTTDGTTNAFVIKEASSAFALDNGTIDFYLTNGTADAYLRGDFYASAFHGNGSGLTNLNQSFTNHSDVLGSTLASGDQMAWNGATGKWTNGPPSGGGQMTEAQITNALGSAANALNIVQLTGNAPTNLLAVNVPSAGDVLTWQSGTAPTWAAPGAASQTPWSSDINGNGFSLTNVSSITLTNDLTLSGSLNVSNIVAGSITGDGSGLTNLNQAFTNHSDVLGATLASGDVLAWNGSTSKWTNGPPAAGSGQMTETQITNTLGATLWKNISGTAAVASAGPSGAFGSAAYVDTSAFDASGAATAATNGYGWTNLTVAHASAVTNGYPWTNVTVALAAVAQKATNDDAGNKISTTYATIASSVVTNGYPWTNVSYVQASGITNGYPWTNIVGPHAFTNHNDVLGAALTSGDVLAWNGATAKWTNGPPATGSGAPLQNDWNANGHGITNLTILSGTGPWTNGDYYGANVYLTGTAEAAGLTSTTTLTAGSGGTFTVDTGGMLSLPGLTNTGHLRVDGIATIGTLLATNGLTATTASGVQPIFKDSGGVNQFTYDAGGESFTVNKSLTTSANNDVTVGGILKATIFDSVTNTWAVDTPLPLGETNYVYVGSGTVTFGITGVATQPTTTARYGVLTIISGGTLTFTNPATIMKASDFASSRVITNGNSCDITVKVIPGQCTNLSIVQYK